MIMKKGYFLLPIICFIFLSVGNLSIHAQQMTNAKLEAILTQEVDSLGGNTGRWEIMYNKLPMMVLTDEKNDRMRIIAPIIEANKLDEGLLLDCLTANFHSALDVKYAISNELLWSVYVHPLSPTSEKELRSALQQVYAAAATFGTTFSSTPLLFGGNQPEKSDEKKEQKPAINIKKT
jgi:hypothetical protein